LAKRAAPTAIDRISIVLGPEATLDRRIYLTVLDAIACGKLTAGSRLPSTRALSRALGVSRNSVTHAFEQLHAEGYLEVKVGSGTRGAGRIPKSTARKQLQSSNQTGHAGPRLASLIARSGYPVEQKEIEDWEGNRLYLHES
jgi:DNA-binding transcriptional MocR family regulator